MRCITCGEYIDKGRKFNARKEDVDNMNHLGLRIYRFYIKCTACLSEISFRTDPANTDYVLEAGATRLVFLMSQLMYPFGVTIVLNLYYLLIQEF